MARASTIGLPSTERCYGRYGIPHAAKQHFLYFLPDPQGQGSLRPIFGPERTKGAMERWW